MKKDRKKFWARILILLLVIATGSLIMNYQKQLAKRDDLQQQLDEITDSRAALIVDQAGQQSKLSVEQLSMKQDKLESDIIVAQDNLRQSTIVSEHVATLVQVAREAAVELVSVVLPETKTSTYHDFEFDIMALKINAEGNTSNTINFVSQICEAFQTGIIRNIEVQIREDNTENTSEKLSLSLDIDIYSYRDQ